MSKEVKPEAEIVDHVRFRMVRPTDIPVCVEIEQASYPTRQAASTRNLQYRQHHAARYFRCAVIGDDDDNEHVIGFICATRVHELDGEAMTSHYSNGILLAIHSVVTETKYRCKGIASAMVKNYIEEMRSMKDDGVQKLVLLAKGHLLSFYVDCGFSVMKPSTIEHGEDSWYELQLDLSPYKSLGRRYYIVDSFAELSLPSSGNPAAVVKLLAGTDPTDPEMIQWMHMVAKEFNLSETAYIWPHEEERQGGEVHWYIRFFTPTIEVNLCGHATLASAAMLYQTLSIKNKNETDIVLHAKADTVHASLTVGGKRSKRGLSATKITLKFPLKAAQEIQSQEDQLIVQDMLLQAFNIPSDGIMFSGLSDTGDVLVELTPQCFKDIGYGALNYDALLKWDGYSRGVILCCLASSEVAESIGTNKESGGVESECCIDFFARFFAPKAGINEDPVTGSAYCALAPYFSAKLGKDKVLGKQLSERGGLVECAIAEDGIVNLSGTAIRTMNGSLYL